MKKQLTLCGVCIAKFKDHGAKVTEHGRRDKVVCDECGKRKFGTLCEVSMKTIKDAK